MEYQYRRHPVHEQARHQLHRTGRQGILRLHEDSDRHHPPNRHSHPAGTLSVWTATYHPPSRRNRQEGHTALKDTDYWLMVCLFLNMVILLQFSGRFCHNIRGK